MVQVIFNYNEPTGRWEIQVLADSELEAMQAFNAVVITCDDVVPGLDHKVSKTTGGLYEIEPTVTTKGFHRSKLFKGGV